MNDFTSKDISKTSRDHAKTTPRDSQTGPRYRSGQGAGRPAPIHIQGVKTDPIKYQTPLDSSIKALDTALELLSKSAVRYLTQKGREEASFSNALRKTIEEAVIESAKKGIEYLPFGKALRLTVQISNAFAEGVGDALVEANEKLIKQENVDFKKLGEEIGQTESDIIQNNFRRYQYNNLKELSSILNKGLDRVVNFLVNKFVDYIVNIPKAVMKDVAGQISSHLVKQNELISIFNEAAKETTNSIPEQRKRVYSSVLYHLTNTFIQQLDNENLKESKKILDAMKSKESISIGILAGIIEMLMSLTSNLISNPLQLEYVSRQLTAELQFKAKALIDVLTQGGIQVRDSKTGTIEISEQSIAIPSNILLSINTTRRDTSPAESKAFLDSLDQFYVYQDGLNISIKAKAIKYQKIIDLQSDDLKTEVWAKLSDKLADERNAADNSAEKMFNEIVKAYSRPDRYIGSYPRRIMPRPELHD